MNILQRALALQLQLHELHYNLGHVLYQQEDLLGAIASYRQAVDLCPNHASAHYNLAVALDEQGQTAAAIPHYRQALSLQQSENNSENDWHPLALKACLNLSQALIQQGQWDEAMQTCQQALAASSSHAISAELYCCLGQAWVAQGQVDRAIAAYQNAVSLKPDLAVAHYELGKIWQQQKQHAAAVRCFQQTIQLQPDQPEVYGKWGSALLELGKFSEAMLCWQRAIALQQIFVESFCQRVANLTEPDSLTQAKIACGQFLTALQHQPDDPSISSYLQQTYFHLANALTEYGGSAIYDQAETYYYQALRLEPPNPTLHLRLADCLIKQQQLKDATAHDRPGLGCAAKLPQHPLAPSPQPPAPLPSPCPGLNCSPCLTQIFRTFEPIHLGKGIHALSNQEPVAPDPIPRSMAKLAGGRAWITPQKNYWQICNAIAIFTSDHHLLPDLSREYPGQLPGCQSAATHQRRFGLNELPLKQIQGRVAVLSGLSGHVYFHWMVDVLPRLELLRQNGLTWDEIDYFLVNSYQQPFQKETLSQLGIPLEKVLESDRHPHLQADCLIVPSFAGHLGWLQTWALEFLRREFLPSNSATMSGTGYVKKSFEYSERLYISRSKARYRNVLNETEVIHLLEQYGFVVITLESLSFQQQIALFAAAKVIVAPHGSGLTNLVFCRSGTKVVELVSPHYIRHYYWVISRQLQLEHYYLPGEGFACPPLRELMYQNPLTEDILVRLDALQSLLKQMNLNLIST